MEDDSSSSPRQRLKFLCSYGGKILPRPADGQLKYLGGETRVVAVPRSVSSSSLYDKIASTFAAPGLVIKYQLMPEDLDALVSVRSDEDLLHMIDEYDRFADLHRPSSPRFRLFLFSPISTRSISSSRAATPPEFTLSPTNTSPTGTIDAAGGGGGGGGGRGGMQRVRSTPNLGELQQSPAAVASPSYLLRHPPLHKYTKAFGVVHHHHGGPHMGGVRYDGYGYPNPVQHPPHVGRRYMYPSPNHVPQHVGAGFGHGGYTCYGHAEERGGGMRAGGGGSSSRPSYHFAAEMPPPLQKPAFE